MKATGIVRKIDELGRVVIPKEIRRTLHMKEGCPVEIYTDNSMIVLRKYSPLNAIENYVEEYVTSIAQICDCTVLVCDDEGVVATAGENAEKYIHAPSSREMTRLMALMDETEIRKDKNLVNVTYNGTESEDYALQIIVPIFSQEHIFGALVLLYPDNRIKEVAADAKVAESAALFFGKTINA